MVPFNWLLLCLSQLCWLCCLVKCWPSFLLHTMFHYWFCWELFYLFSSALFHDCLALPFRSSSISVVFHFGRLPFRSSSISVVFHFGRLIFHSDICKSVLHFFLHHTLILRPALLYSEFTSMLVKSGSSNQTFDLVNIVAVWKPLWELV